MATVIAPITPAEFGALYDPEGRDFELLNGELIEMPSASGSHNFLAAKLSDHLGPWLRGRSAGVVIPDTEFAIGEGRLRPDLAVVSLTKWRRIGVAPVPLPEPPDIAVEIISPSESAMTLEMKIAAYLDSGVTEVWELYHETEHLFIHTTDGVRRLDRDSVIETPLFPGWSLPMSELLSKDNGVYF
jgi:Uma2 family endonuclease